MALRRRAVTSVILVAFALALLVLLAFPHAARAYQEPNDLEGGSMCSCHPGASYPDMDCEACHGDVNIGGDGAEGYEPGNYAGPHSGYTTGTTKCDNCHKVHWAALGPVLLPGPTVVDTCLTCHDGTGASGVYGVIEARTGSEPGGGHRNATETIIPGGDAATGGELAGSFNGPGGTLICTDCHSPHGSGLVEPFLGDRRRLRYPSASIRSARLLRQLPTGATTPTTEYGSDWCLGCHAGRGSGGSVMNHPVDSTAATSTPYYYENVPVLDSDDPTSVTVLGTMGGIPVGPNSAHVIPDAPDAAGNRGYLMPYPRTAEQAGHGPICQQCHEDSRSVGALVGDGSQADAAEAFVAYADGVDWNGTTWVDSWDAGWDNPAFQNFPHETLNTRMLVEPDDDLCLNCHPKDLVP